MFSRRDKSINQDDEMDEFDELYEPKRKRVSRNPKIQSVLDLNDPVNCLLYILIIYSFFFCRALMFQNKLVVILVKMSQYLALMICFKFLICNYRLKQAMN